MRGGAPRTASPRVLHSWTPFVNAPSITRLVPLVKLDAGLAKNTTPRAISSGLAMRPIGFSLIAVANSSGFPISIWFQMPPSKYVLPGDRRCCVTRTEAEFALFPLGSGGAHDLGPSEGREAVHQGNAGVDLGGLA